MPVGKGSYVMSLWFEDARQEVARSQSGKRYSKQVSLKGTKPSMRKILVWKDGKLVGLIEEKTKTAWREKFEISIIESRRGISRYYCSAKTVFEGKQKLREWSKSCEDESHFLKSAKGRVNVRSLPASPDSEFFPTPSALAGKMIASINWKDVRTVLEPSAGKGDLLESLERFASSFRSPLERRNFDVHKSCDVVESDPNLQFILRGKGFHLVGDDFITFAPCKRYDVIIMNPPFSDGDRHLLRALALQCNGGQICCLLNAETIRNPYSNPRKLLVQKLMEYNARIEFVQNAFKRSERPTDVEVAIVTVNIPKPARKSRIMEELRSAERYRSDSQGPTAIAIAGDWINELLSSYRMEVDGGIAFLSEYIDFAPYIMSSESEHATPIIELKIDGNTIGHSKLNENDIVNSYLTAIRQKYWNLLMYHSRLQEKTGAMPSAMVEEYRDKAHDMAQYEFDEFNIRQLILDIQLQLNRGMEDAIIALFEKLSAEHSYLPETGKNRWYYNGWKTNKAHKVGMKSIIPVNGCFADSWQRETLNSYRVFHILCDIEKVMDFLDRGKTEFHNNLEFEIRRANAKDKTVLDCTYFTARFYKKGTCHIKFKPEAQHIIDRLNIFAGSKYNWLPPTYGKKHYDDMSEEEKLVIDGFQGKEEYEKVVSSPHEYLIQPSSQLCLT